MEMLALIVALSTIMWYIIDRFKDLWANVTWGKYITIIVSAIFAFALSFGFNLDLIFALGLVETSSIMGTILTGFTLMGGSSAVAELIEAIKGKQIKTNK